MDPVRLQDTQQSKSSTLRHREASDESVDRRPSDSSVDLMENEKRPIRRVLSPSRPRVWLPNSYKPKFVGRSYRSHFIKDDHSFHKPGFGSHKYQHFSPRAYSNQRHHSHPKLHHAAPKEREREKEKERYEQRESFDKKSPPEQSSTTTPFLSRSTSSRDKDMQFTICQTEKNQRERDHRRTKSKEREQSRDRELPLTSSQTAARDRAIQQKRREIDEVYYQECEMFGLVTKMLIEKDRSLEVPIQASLQENLRDIGERCIKAMEKFIEDYDSRELTR
ncbi:periphilin-1 [Echeneis naucrates]|uniref:Periphilin-1-like n=1 Tax=Echeneis naucrates TaxID=173247 RepID=A0A665THX6_ECHNA|nr:periphilin-1-like [Echeneis naucrates]